MNMHVLGNYRTVYGSAVFGRGCTGRVLPLSAVLGQEDGPRQDKHVSASSSNHPAAAFTHTN